VNFKNTDRDASKHLAPVLHESRIESTKLPSKLANRVPPGNKRAASGSEDEEWDEEWEYFLVFDDPFLAIEAIREARYLQRMWEEEALAGQEGVQA
jgi:hypothetical protein